MKFARGLPLGIVLALLVLTACAYEGPSVPRGPSTGPRFQLGLTPGPSYKTSTTWFIFRIPVYPQVAVWLETMEGRYLGTLYVTAKAAKKSWISAPSLGRPEALPVWNHLMQEELDAVAAATSAGETNYASNLAKGLPAGSYLVKLETNRSYDYNAVYTKTKSGVSGQPSLVYQAELVLGKGPQDASFTVLGTGSLDGSNGLVQAGVEGIDTAFGLFSRMSVSYRE